MKQQKKNSDCIWLLGHINWFDPNSGKGSIIGDDGVWYRIHELSEIQDKKAGHLKCKARVEFVLANDSVHPIIKAVRLLEYASVVKTKSKAKGKSVRPPEKESSV